MREEDEVDVTQSTIKKDGEDTEIEKPTESRCSEMNKKLECGGRDGQTEYYEPIQDAPMCKIKTGRRKCGKFIYLIYKKPIDLHCQLVPTFITYHTTPWTLKCDDAGHHTYPGCENKRLLMLAELSFKSFLRCLRCLSGITLCPLLKIMLLE